MPIQDLSPPQSRASYQQAQLQNVDARTVADILLSEKAITPLQYEELRVKSASQGVSADTIIEKEHLVSDAKFSEARAKLLGIPYISLANASFSPEALSLLSRPVVERFKIIPFHFDDKEKVLSVAMANPLDTDAVSFIRQKTGFTIKAFAAAPNEVAEAITTQYRQEIVAEVDEALKEKEEEKESHTIDSKQIAEIIQEAPIAKIVSTVLEYAVNSRSSDVHIEPQEDRVRVRYRIDGILYDKLSLPKAVQEAVVSRIKILSEMKIDEHRTPQDGRFNFKIGSNEVDLRISVMPTAHGEKIVMRLLRKSGGIPTLPELGLAGTALKNLEASILRPHGIILVCGPTGSGKTTTLYALLSRLNTARVNIMSLEDPIEYQIAGVNHVQINPAVGLTFATGLRAFLRQDPNIILVGEIRDTETAELAIQAALTGHLIFSTLHTSDAASGIPRLLDLGAENFLLSSTVTALVGQRIVRKICSNCKGSYIPPKPLVDEMRSNLGKLFTLGETEVKLYRGKGCLECGSSGYLGRVGIFEVLTVSMTVAQMILEKANSAMIAKQAIAEGMITMKQDGYLKALSGVTTIEEILRVAQE
ncbi:MAG: Flp pilus assembly complex ATPase component TadA [Candidatus Levybacteria bacterium]|nr:Flp pilus assembly complex ATPase component TadA [Candidatus Levybacteria bacterium]